MEWKCEYAFHDKRAAHRSLRAQKHCGSHRVCATREPQKSIADIRKEVQKASRNHIPVSGMSGGKRASSGANVTLLFFMSHVFRKSDL
jgi:hypothetical protein